MTSHCFDCVQVVWAVKHSHIGDAFFDLDAAAFLCTQLPQAQSPAQRSEAQASSAQHLAAQHSATNASAAQRSHAAPVRSQKEPNSVQLQAENVATQEDTAAQVTSACAGNLRTLDSADEQADSAAPNSAESLDTAQDPDHSQHQLPQRTWQQRRGMRRCTDRKFEPGPQDQPDLNHTQSKPVSKVEAEQVCALCLTSPFFDPPLILVQLADCRVVSQRVVCTQHTQSNDSHSLWAATALATCIHKQQVSAIRWYDLLNLPVLLHCVVFGMYRASHFELFTLCQC